MTVVSAIVHDGNVSAIVRDENVSAIVRDWNMSATVPSLESITERRLALGRRHMYSKGHNTTGVRIAPTLPPGVRVNTRYRGHTLKSVSDYTNIP